MPLFDYECNLILGVENKKAAQLALARVKLAGDVLLPAETPATPEEWLVAKVCSEYLQYCERGFANKTISAGHRENSKRILNKLCAFCGALPFKQLKKGHVKTWFESHPKWKSPAANAVSALRVSSC